MFIGPLILYVSINRNKTHEKIYENRMKERADQMNNIKTQIGPIYVFYPANESIEKIWASPHSLFRFGVSIKKCS